MLKKIRSTFKENDKKQLVRNFFSLSMLQMMNYALPLIVVPYLFTTLGTEKYGLVVFAQAIVIYFGLFISYGFSLSATKE
ncbi:MAG: oligosaccharide flippase family protein, partial [Methylophilaceae bacterium]